MSVFKLIFIYGVVITIFNIIWFFIEWVIKLLLSSSNNNINPTIKTISIAILSTLLAHESNLFVINKSLINTNYEWLIKVSGALILFIYIVGKAEKRNLKMFANFNQVNITNQSDYPKWLPYVGVVLYAAGLFIPELSNNQITNWFHENINDIYHTIFLKFIFSIIAFFFMLDIISRALNYFGKIGRKETTNFNNHQQKNNDNFDDYEIVDDNKLNE